LHSTALFSHHITLLTQIFICRRHPCLFKIHSYCCLYCFVQSFLPRSFLLGPVSPCGETLATSFYIFLGGGPYNKINTVILFDRVVRICFLLFEFRIKVEARDSAASIITEAAIYKGSCTCKLSSLLTQAINKFL